MSKLAILKFGQGSFESGFPVTLRLSNEGELATLELDGALSAAPTLTKLAQTWQFSYRSRSTLGNLRQLKVPNAQVTRQRSSLIAVSKDWICALNDWLNGGDRAFQPIRDQLLKAISSGEEVRLVIQADQLELWQFPWHLWNLVQDHSNIDVTFSLNTFAAASIPEYQSDTQVKILVLLGDSTHIDIQTDLQLLTEHLPDANIHIPAQVGREQLCHDLWQQSWDILFFAGHSSSQLNEGRFYLNQDVYLTIDDLRYALKRAISNGLQLAIFNSCDGMELARALADLQLPATIVMRERIPDAAAQKFLHYFLNIFAHTNQPLHLAVREAREKLHTALDDKYPCASWLPIVCQSPVSLPLSWQSFHRIKFRKTNSILEDQPVQVETKRRHTKNQDLCFRRTLISSLLISCLVIGVRSLGWLNLPELWAYDRLMQLQPELPLDPRILVVTVTDDDAKTFSKPLPDETVYRLLTTLEQYQPRVIGLDIFRDFPVGPGRAQLLQLLQHNSRIVSVCQVGEELRLPSVPGAEGVPPTQLGFADALMIDDDQLVRRYSLTMTARDQTCPTEESLALRVIRRYLSSNTFFNLSENLNINGTKIPTLKAGVAGYQQVDRVGWGLQVLTRYNRSHRIAEEITLTQLLTKPSSHLIRDQIILIGYTGEHTQDIHPTSVGNMYGVRIHAHAVSQILNVLTEERSFITPASAVIDLIWIVSWASVGGVLSWRFRGLRIFWLASGLALGGLLLSCLVLFSQGLWIPITPAILVLLSATQASRLIQSPPRHLNFKP